MRFFFRFKKLICLFAGRFFFCEWKLCTFVDVIKLT